MDICGHRGMLEACGRILSHMVSRDVPADTRTIASILNCIAVSVRLRDSNGALGPMSQGGESNTDALHLTDGESFVRKTIQTPTVDEKEFSPNLSPLNAISLALRLYASWHGRSAEPHALNALLKVLRATSSGHLVPAIMSLYAGIGGGDVSKEIGSPTEGGGVRSRKSQADAFQFVTADRITYTAALQACSAIQVQLRGVGQLSKAFEYGRALYTMHLRHDADAKAVSAAVALVRNTLVDGSHYRTPKDCATARRLTTAQRVFLRSEVLPLVPSVEDLDASARQSLLRVLHHLRCRREAESIELD